MKKEKLIELLGIEELRSFELFEAFEFEKLICEKLQKFGLVEKQVRVADRGDGRSGRIDLVFHYRGEQVPIELDRKTPRQKSIFKVRSVNPKSAFVITREQFRVIQV